MLHVSDVFLIEPKCGGSDLIENCPLGTAVNDKIIPTLTTSNARTVRNIQAGPYRLNSRSAQSIPGTSTKAVML